MPVSAQILVGHGLPLLERMGRPSDIALLNFGAWHGSGDGPEFRKLVEDFRDAVADRAGRLPRLVWKEMVPTHYDQQHGLYPGRPVAPDLARDTMGSRALKQACARAFAGCRLPHALAARSAVAEHALMGCARAGLLQDACGCLRLTAPAHA